MAYRIIHGSQKIYDTSRDRRYKINTDSNISNSVKFVSFKLIFINFSVKKRYLLHKKIQTYC